MGETRLLTTTKWKMAGKKCFMNNDGFDFGGEVVLEAITLLMGVGQYFAAGT